MEIVPASLHEAKILPPPDVTSITAELVTPVEPLGTGHTHVPIVMVSASVLVGTQFAVLPPPVAPTSYELTTALPLASKVSCLLGVLDPAKVVNSVVFPVLVPGPSVPVALYTAGAI